MVQGTKERITAHRLFATRRYILSTHPVLYISGRRDFQGTNQFLSDDAYGHLCTRTGALWTPQGYSFDGIDDYITVPDSPSLTFTDGAGADKPFSAIMWVNPTNYNNFATLVAKRNSGTVLEWVWNIQQTNGQMNLRLYSGSGTTIYIGQQSTDAVGTGALICLGFTYDGNEASSGVILYKNGVVLASSASQAGSYVGMSDTVALVSIGAHHTQATPANFLIGNVGAVWLYNRVLTALEMQFIFLVTKWRY